jgi:hypothetical protein
MCHAPYRAETPVRSLGPGAPQPAPHGYAADPAQHSRGTTRNGLRRHRQSACTIPAPKHGYAQPPKLHAPSWRRRPAPRLFINPTPARPAPRFRRQCHIGTRLRRPEARASHHGHRRALCPSRASAGGSLAVRAGCNISRAEEGGSVCSLGVRRVPAGPSVSCSQLH